MTDNAFTETDHPRTATGEFSTKAQSEPEIPPLGRSAAQEAVFKALVKRRLELTDSIRNAKNEMAKLNAKEVAIDLLDEFPTATTITLTEADDGGIWWANDVRDADGQILTDELGDLDIYDIPTKKPSIVNQLPDHAIEITDAPGFEWLTFTPASHDNYPGATINLAAAAALEI